jgi:hypothetical protein
MKQSQPKSEQKFRSQTQDLNNNRNRTKLNPNTNPISLDMTVKSSARDRSVGVKQKAVRQFLEQTLAAKKLK